MVSGYDNTRARRQTWTYRLWYLRSMEPRNYRIQQKLRLRPKEIVEFYQLIRNCIPVNLVDTKSSPWADSPILQFPYEFLQCRIGKRLDKASLIQGLDIFRKSGKRARCFQSRTIIKQQSADTIQYHTD